MRRAARRPTGTAALAILLAVAGWLFWPSGLGGRTTYVTTHGVSMQPRFHAGDLAIVRPARSYGVGDVVAFRSAQLDTVVMHRIVDVDGERYTLKGDNNSWLDPERPGRDEIVGRLAVRVPSGGVWLRRATGPVGRALVAFVLVAAAGGSTVTLRRRKRRSMGRHRCRSSRSAPALSTLPPALRMAAATAGFSGVAGLALGALTWTGPVHTETSSVRPVSRSVTFSYTASVPKTAAYDSTTVAAPDPVFRKVAQDVTVSFAYQGGAARVSVVATLSAASGWRSTVPLAAERAVDAGRYEGTVRLDLAALSARAQKAAQATGIPIDQVNVDVVPRIAATDGTTFAPAMKLVLTPSQLKVADEQKTLTISDAATVTTPSREPRTVSILGRSFQAETGRRWSVLLLGVALVAGIAVFHLARRAAPKTEAAAIRRKYATLLLPVLPTALPADRPVVDVPEFAALAKLAERYGLLVQHWSRGDVTTFVVRDESTTYRYRIGARVTPVPASDVAVEAYSGT